MRHKWRLPLRRYGYRRMPQPGNGYWVSAQRMRFGKPSILHQKHGQGCGLPPSGPVYVTLAAQPAHIHQDSAPPSRTHPNVMSYTSLILVVLAAMAHAAWNLLAKRAAMVGPMFVFAYGLAATILYAPG